MCEHSHSSIERIKYYSFSQYDNGAHVLASNDAKLFDSRGANDSQKIIISTGLILGVRDDIIISSDKTC